MSNQSFNCNLEEVRETRFTADSVATVDVDWAPLSNSREEFSCIAMLRASSAAVVLHILSSQWNVESLNPLVKLLRTICSRR